MDPDVVTLMHHECGHRDKSEERGRTITRLRRQVRVWERAYRDLWHRYRALQCAVRDLPTEAVAAPWTVSQAALRREDGDQ